MNKRIEKPIVGEEILVTDARLCELLSLGRWSATRIAEQAGAVIKIGRTRRTDIAKVKAYLNEIEGA